MRTKAEHIALFSGHSGSQRTQPVMDLWWKLRTGLLSATTTMYNQIIIIIGKSAYPDTTYVSIAHEDRQAATRHSNNDELSRIVSVYAYGRS